MVSGPNSIDSVNFYNWALADAQEELANDFEHIRNVPCLSSAIHTSILSTLSAAEKLQYVHYRVRIMHREALILCNDTLSDVDHSMKDLYSSTYSRYLNSYQKRLFQAVSSKKEKQPTKAETTSVLLSAIQKILPGELVAYPPMSWKLTSPFQNFHTCMFLIVQKSHMGYITASYSFKLSSNPDNERPVLEDGSHVITSKLWWLGFGRTTWDIATPQDLQIAIESISLCTEQYKTAASHMIPKDTNN